jgi:3-dehydroquinate synthase
MSPSAQVTRITVKGEPTYDVLVGRGLVDKIAEGVPTTVHRVLLVHTGAVATIAKHVSRVLRGAGYVVTDARVPDGEAAKGVQTAADLWSTLGQAGFTRSDAIVGVGGGATTDVAGFVAATWLRGVSVVHVPTTLLAMVDAAVGGKTAIDTPEGKNLVGAFHSPTAVVCDLDLLGTLPRADIAAGLAEVIKAGLIADPAILELVEDNPHAALDPSSDALRELVERAIRVKAAVVSDDLRELGGREILNYGHTLAHAIEKVEEFRWRHGDAVSVGMVFAAELAFAAGRLDADTVNRHRSVLTLLGLPTSYRRDVWPDLRAAMAVDKKSRGDQLRFVVLDGLARPGLLQSPAESLLVTAFAKVGAWPARDEPGRR